MSNETPRLIECPIKSFRSDGSEGVTVTLKIPEHVADAVVRAAASREPMLCILAQERFTTPNASGLDGAPWQIAERAVIFGPQGNVALMDGARALCRIENSVVDCTSGNELDTIRVWLAGLIREGYEAGIASVAQTKADGAAALVETYGPDALAKAREEGRADAFRKVAEWCQTSVPDTVDFDASIVEEVAKDAIGRLQNDAYNGDSRAREEGRRQGWEEAASCFDATAKHHADNRDSKQREAHSLRAQAARLDEEARVQQETAKMARAVAAELRAAAPKEPA